MKKLLLSCLLILGSCFFLRAQDKQAIINVLETQRTAWNKGDIDTYMQGYWKSDSLMFIGHAAPTYGWQPTLVGYKRAYPDKAAMGQLTFDIMKINILDLTTAFVLGTWHLRRGKAGLGGYFTRRFSKVNWNW